MSVIRTSSELLELLGRGELLRRADEAMNEAAESIAKYRGKARVSIHLDLEWNEGTADISGDVVVKLAKPPPVRKAVFQTEQGLLTLAHPDHLIITERLGGKNNV